MDWIELNTTKVGVFWRERCEENLFLFLGKGRFCRKWRWRKRYLNRGCECVAGCGRGERERVGFVKSLGCLVGINIILTM